MAKTFKELVADALKEVDEVFPWDLEDYINEHSDVLLLDIREPYEYKQAALKNSILAPRGILESACDWDYDETIPELVNARKRPIVIVCRSGNRSALAAITMRIMGYENLTSLKMGVKGCNDSDIPLYDQNGKVVDPDWADEFLNPPLRDDQKSG